MTDREAIDQLAESFDIGGDLTDLTYVRAFDATGIADRLRSM